MRSESTVEPGSRRVKARNVLYLLGGLLVVFLIGAGWQFLRAEGLEARLEASERELTFTRLESTLGAATLEARRGSYEVARQLASAFYDGLQDRIVSTPDAARLHFTAVLDRRDDVITGLSRAQENTGVLLSDLYLQWRSGMAELARAEGWATAAPAAPAS
jgi:hypothetical protein